MTPQTPQPAYVKTAAPGDIPAINAAVEALFSQLPVAARLSAATHVLVKPNLLAKHKPEAAVTTHPDVLRAVLLALKSRGVQNITVADSPGGPYTPESVRQVYEASGLAAVCRAEGAALYTACESCERDCAGTLIRSFTLIRPACDCDFIVNLAKFKTHALTGVTGATKNLFGCVPGLQKAEFHMRFPQKEHFGQMLVDLCACVGADIHLVDGLVGMEGDGPAGGRPRTLGLLLAGENPYTVDHAICHYMGFPPMDTPVLAAAHRTGLCEAAFNPALLVGDEVDKRPIEGFVLPKSFHGGMDSTSRIPAPLRPVAKVFTRAAAPKPAINRQRCIGCGKCAEICPERVITLQNQKAHIAYGRCIRCFCCHEICPVKAVDIRRMRLFGL